MDGWMDGLGFRLAFVFFYCFFVFCFYLRGCWVGWCTVLRGHLPHCTERVEYILFCTSSDLIDPMYVYEMLNTPNPSSIFSLLLFPDQDYHRRNWKWVRGCNMYIRPAVSRLYATISAPFRAEVVGVFTEKKKNNLREPH